MVAPRVLLTFGAFAYSQFNLVVSALITLTRHLTANKTPLKALSPFCPKRIEFQNKRCAQPSCFFKRVQGWSVRVPDARI